MKVSEYLKANPIVPSEYPNIHLDTYAYCNASCIFCGYSDMTRKKGRMSRGLLNHILDDIALWDTPTKEIVPIHYGEFFLNPDWLYVLECIQGKLPRTKIAIPTNGSLLDDSKIDRLVRIRTLKYLSFSIYGYFDETYERLTGLSPGTIGRVEHAITRIRQLRPDIHIAVGATFHPPFITDYETRLLLRKWHPYVQCHIVIGNSQMNKDFMKDYPSEIPCISIFLSFIVLWDGRVCLCCYDPNGEIIVGDVKRERLLDIWQGELVKKYQNLHAAGKRDTIPLCRTCSFACP